MREWLSKVVYRKRLPADLGSVAVYVTPRSDLRVLFPGFHQCAGDLMAIARTYIDPGDVVWDIGSNLGIFASCAAAKAGPTGKVFAVEADPTYASIQHRTFTELPASCAPVSVLCAAVADQVGIFDFAVSSRGHARSGLAGISDAPSNATKMVPAVTLDYLGTYWPAPNFVKIDVEGAGFLVLQGATALLRITKPILYTEMTEKTYEDASALLREQGYELFELQRDGSVKAVNGFTQDVIAKPRKQASASMSGALNGLALQNA